MSKNSEEAIPLKAKGKGRTPEIVPADYEFSYMKKPKKKTFSEMIYDKKKGKYFGRTPKNWGKLREI